METKKDKEEVIQTKKKEQSEKKDNLCKCKSNKCKSFFLVLLFFLAVVLLLNTTFLNNKNRNGISSMGKDEARNKVEKFINESLMRGGGKAEVKEVSDRGDFYEMTVNINGREINSGISKDGKKFFTEVMDIEETEKKMEEEKKKREAEKEQEMKEMAKYEKPEVELFVMSHCPYGTQIEKGLLPVLDTLGDKIDFKLKFCDYAMHGKKELDEELRQHCIQKEEPRKLKSYLKCFLEKGESEKCLEKTSIDSSKIESCVSKTDKEYKVTENYNNKDTWKGNFPSFDVYKEDNSKYGVSGSPTLVVNGKKVSPGRDPNSLLKMICAGFESSPEECDKQLSSTAFSPGFGLEKGSNNGASCGN